jgi:hypothetical protein
MSLSDIKPKLAKLIPLLGSPNSNEAQAAARAITRLLASEKCDWHDIVKLVCGAEPEYPKQYTKPQPRPSSDDGWRISAKGNPWRKFGRITATIIRSNSPYRTGDYSVLIFEDDEKTYLNNFDSVDEAKEAARVYCEEAGAPVDDDPPF